MAALEPARITPRFLVLSDTLCTLLEVHHFRAGGRVLPRVAFLSYRVIRLCVSVCRCVCVLCVCFLFLFIFAVSAANRISVLAYMPLIQGLHGSGVLRFLVRLIGLGNGICDLSTAVA